MKHDDPDMDLLERIADGDQAAGRVLVERHSDRLFGFAMRMLGRREDAEDVVQESFMRAWRSADRWRPTASVSSWLHRITHNLSVDRLRARRPDLDIAEVDPPDDKADPAALHQATEVARHVAAAIETLPERQRAALLLVHYQDLSGSEAAEVLDITIEALESLLARGRRTLRAKLSPERDNLMGDT
ncbi:MAG: RNA polymerase sigma factor [Rhodospirillaceae bacterium]|nr:RNA polymerase sigma factor [Rhodospirillaceae bacterium]